MHPGWEDGTCSGEVRVHAVDRDAGTSAAGQAAGWVAGRAPHWGRCCRCWAWQGLTGTLTKGCRKSPGDATHLQQAVFLSDNLTVD